ncbi:MAG: UDP-N-acetylmuramoyl-L-alanine--D-glutamate ligase [Lachnospiraceae bacterium]|nr:MAG: UDP-N-acetylmuramoyl-L-alanine--D-glutamate ligase [Lachnospiraceae bacterium]
MIGVAGLGKSGISAANLLLKNGEEVVLFDSNKELDKNTVLDKFDKKYHNKIKIILGDLKASDVKDMEYCVISPGIDLEVEFVKTLKSCKVPVWSEIELGYKYSRGDLIAVTGTNGKTTTTALVGEIMSNFKESSFTVGNIGIPYTDIADKTNENTVTVLETSSFQLETVIDFRPKISAILNITPDHLNRHHTMENYIRVKEDISKNQDENDFCILNYEDAALREFAKRVKAKVVFFSSKERLDNGFYLEGGFIMHSVDGNSTKLLDTGKLNILGRHNYENVMAATAIAFVYGVPQDIIVNTCYNFHAVEHRIEFVKEVNGVKYYNDSKGTNPDAAIQAVLAMPATTYIIGGGYDKGSEYDEWIESFGTKVKKLVLMGATAKKIADCAKKHGFTDIEIVESMEEAVKLCAGEAKAGEYVLLSPACASWGMFKNYEERGKIFKDCVRNLG